MMYSIFLYRKNNFEELFNIINLAMKHKPKYIHEYQL